MAYRGIRYYEGQVTQSKVIRAVKEFDLSHHLDEPSQFSFLFYHHESDTLHAWLFNYRGIVAETHTRITTDSLLNLESTLKFSMSIDKVIGTTDRTKQELVSTRKYRLKTPQSIDLLSRILFPKELVTGITGQKHLLIMPAVNLSTIPFSMLKPWPNSKGTLIDSMSYAFAHNFQQFFGEIEASSQPTAGSLVKPVIVGNPSFSDVCTSGLTPLAGAEQEAKRVSELLHTRALTGINAAKDTIIKAMQASTFIYLATHGWSDTEDPLRKSFIALYGDQSCGYLTPFEIQSLDLSSNPVVVLSACQSGLGRVMEAGIVGVARGFLKAGARSVTMSLWNVDDTETAELMTEFVTQLQKPQAFFPAEHWRQAVLEYRKRKKKDEPLNWAAFQTFGVPSRTGLPVKLHE